MHKTILILVIMSLCYSKGSASKYVVDSLNKKQGFSVLVSMKPVVNWLSKKDSSANFFYSKVQFELQYHYKRHVLGLGFNGNHQKYLTPVNGLPNITENIVFSYAPSYSFLFYSNKRWKGYSGISYIYNYEKNLKTSQSNIENISKSTVSIQEGAALFFRAGYSFTKHLSVELEAAFYATRLRMDFTETYPLTPSMNSMKSSYLVNQTFSVPSNLFVKFTF